MIDTILLSLSIIINIILSIFLYRIKKVTCKKKNKEIRIIINSFELELNKELRRVRKKYNIIS